MTDKALLALAEAAGLVVDWVDADQRAQRVTPAVLRRILASLELPADSPAQIAQSLAQLQQDADQLSLPPLLTLDAGTPLDLCAHFAAGTPFELLYEDGSRHAGQLDHAGRLPGLDQIGYPQLCIGDQQLTLAVAPAQGATLSELTGSARPSSWGLGVQLYALRRAGDGGIGDTLALEQLIRAAAARGADAVAISPVHAMFSADTRRFSPYSPSSRLFFNILHAAPGSLLGEAKLRRAIDAEGLGPELARLERLELLDWPAAARAKLRLLRRLFRGFGSGDDPHWQDFLDFRRDGAAPLENHCRFEALHGVHTRDDQPCDWHCWPAQFHQPESPAVARFAAEHADEVSFHAFAQWLISRCLERTQQAARSAGMRIGLINDLAVGADVGGSQAWSRQAELLSTLHIGAPPDILNRSGQNWGLSAFSPRGLHRHGYRAFIEMLRANLAHAGGLRIDHVMGLERLWVIPQGADPADGAYLRYPLHDLLRLLALESSRHQALILGEDLGTVPAGFSAKLAARGGLGMRVLLFERDEQSNFAPPDAWPADALATTSTHDLPTLSGWWLGRDLDWRQRLGLLDAQALAAARETRERERDGLCAVLATATGMPLSEPPSSAQVLDASIVLLAHTPAPLVLLPMEDVLGLEQQANLPGTFDQHPNWRRRWHGDSAHLLDGKLARHRLQLLARARQRPQERP
jgi:4-alpha-glucanotransferase